MSFAQKNKNENNQKNLSLENKRSFEETGFVKCLTTENEAYLRQQYPERATDDQFENWMVNKIEEVRQERLANPNSNRMVVITIPVVVHVVHSGQAIGTAPNITDAQVISQITAMNEDFRKLVGTPGDGTGVDVELEFCLAQQDPNGNPTDGINRFDSTAIGTTWSGPGGSTDTTLKPATIWDPTIYMNMWSVQFTSATLLGYAQFPDASGLPGLDASGGAANSDGVVAAYSTFGDIGSNDGTFLLNAPYDRGRTMTHEVGHYLGLRHIWGDANCGDDFCADTPTQQTSSAGNCPATTTCNGVADLTTNYMDYSTDSCMNNFTQNQKDRMLIVMTNSPRRMELANSVGCTPAQIFNLDGKVDINNLNFIDCTTSSIEPVITITNRGNNTLTSASIIYNVDGGANTTINWAGSLAINQTENLNIPLISVASGTHTFNVELANPNGGTDQQLINNTDTQSFTTTGSLCAAAATNADADRITRVIFNTINNVTLAASADDPYQDFTAISTDIERNSSHDLTVHVNTNGDFPYVISAWIDWNQNCTFDDNEKYNLGTALNDVDVATTDSPYTIMAPADAVLGTTTMRIMMKNEQIANVDSLTPCETAFWGQVEDYSINVLAPLSVDEFALSGISIFPNPTNTILNIKGNVTLESVEVYSITGQRVISTTTNLETINVSAIANGVYFLKIKAANASRTLKFIKE